MFFKWKFSVDVDRRRGPYDGVVVPARTQSTTVAPTVAVPAMAQLYVDIVRLNEGLFVFT